MVELMICLVLSSIILLGLLMTTVRHKIQLERQSLELQLENNLQYAKYQLEQALRGAGYVGCGNLDNVRVHSTAGEAKALSGTSHTLKVAYAETDSVYLLKNMEDSFVDLVLQNNFKKNQRLVISDCQSADIFLNMQANWNVISHPEFQKAYTANAALSVWNEQFYEVSQTRRKLSDGQPIYALYIKSFNADREELVENIVQMDLDYAKNIDDFDHKISFQEESQARIIRIKLTAGISFRGESIRKNLIFFVTLRNRVR